MRGDWRNLPLAETRTKVTMTRHVPTSIHAAALPGPSLMIWPTVSWTG
jgi:hypothetical protein